MKCDFSGSFNKIKIYNGAEALMAALFSLSATALILWLVKPFIYRRTPVYEELVTGGTVWEGYYKQGDMVMFCLLLVLIPLLFAAFLFALHLKKGSWERREKGSRAEETGGQALKWIPYLQYFAAVLIGLVSIRALKNAVIAFWISRFSLWEKGAFGASWIFMAVSLVIFVYFLVKKKDIAPLSGKMLMLLQLFPAFGFLGCYKFYYDYQGADDLIQLYASSRWKLLCFGLFGAFFLCQLWQIGKKKKGVYLSTMVMTGMMGVASTPEGILSVDFFHNGEMSFPMQQLLSYGKAPYFDGDPIHGFCDFFYSLINQVFFDGTYMAQNAAVMAAELFMAAVLAAVMGKCIHNRYAAFFAVYFLMPYLVQKAGVRYLVFFMAFLILFSDGVRKDSRKFLWWWVFLCIGGISWNVSIGSSMAVAFLPEVVYRLIKDLVPELKRIPGLCRGEKIKWGISYGFLILLGISYIPLFLQILRFLGENAGTTLYVNGTPVFGEDFHFIRTFGIAVPYLCMFIYALWGKGKEKAAFISVVFNLAVIGNYACVRYDEGIRLAVLCVFFGMLFVLEIARGKGLPETAGRRWLAGAASGVCAVLVLYLGWEYLPENNRNTMAPEKVSESMQIEIMGQEKEEPVVYVSGDSVGMPDLGTGFIQGSTLNSLKNVQTVLNRETEGNRYLDLTNKISHYVIFNKESQLPFTSAYNISNRKMQEKAIALVKEETPELILISPLIQFDLAPVSLRSMEFYTTLIKMGYQPYVYEDVVYLKKGDAVLEEAMDGRRNLGLICHKDYLGMLPFLWGNSMENNREELGLVLKETAYECFESKEEGNVLNIRLDESVKGTEISYIEFIIEADQIEEEQWDFSFSSQVDGQSHGFLILGGKDTGNKNEGDVIAYLIPVGSSPFWQFSDIKQFRLRGIKEIKEMKVYQ